jgi:hypothetical protein
VQGCFTAVTRVALKLVAPQDRKAKAVLRTRAIYHSSDAVMI